MFAGHDRYNAYGAQLAIEGIARMAAGFVVVALAGAAGGFALGLSVALLISVVLTLPGLRGGHRRSATVTAAPESPTRRTQLTILAWMILGGLMMQILVNLAPVIVKADPHQSPGAAGHYLGGLMLARLPLFVFAAVQAALLPGLAHTVADGDREGLRRQLFGLFALIGASMSLFTIALAVAGPSLVDLVYGNRFGLGRSDLVLLAAGTGTAMAAMVVSSAVVAVGAPGRSALMWTAAVAVLAAVLLLPGTLFWRLEISYLAGAAAALAGQLIALLHRTGTAGSSAAIVRGRT
jgi:O-antigen/teichoic acid export membrane protein